MRQTGDLAPQGTLTEKAWMDRLRQAIQELDVDAAKQDVLPFLRDTSQLELWSEDFFRAVADMIQMSR